LLCGADPNVKTFVCAKANGNAEGTGDDAGEGGGGACVEAVAAIMRGNCPLGAGSWVFGGSVGSAAGVGIA
jgi:hypothetical protein